MHILIFRTDRIGDLLITCPSIISVKEYFKDCQISLVSSDRNYSYAKRLKIFDQIYIFPKKSLIKKLFFIKMLKKKKFDYIFVFDGKERSIIASKFIDANFKVALTTKIKIYYRLTNIKFLVNNDTKIINEIFQEALNLCKINVKIEHYDFLKKIEDNKFSSFIPIKNYIHIHLDEKWFSNLYINKYTDINPDYEEFIDFINTISEKKNILITSGSSSFILTEELKAKYFEEKSNNIFLKKNFNNSIYFADKTTFYDIESLLRNSDILISCHGAITHAANSFDIIQVDIIEKDKEVFYKKFTAHLGKYTSIYRTDFALLKKTLYKKISSYE